MVNASGIGTCIRGWLPHTVRDREDWWFVLLGNVVELSKFEWAKATNVTVKAFDAPIYSLREQWGFWRLHGEAYDLLWVPHFNIPLFWPGRLMVTVHDVVFLAMPEFFGPAKRAYAWLFFKRVRNRADAVFFVSKFTRDEFTRLIGAPKGASEVIYNGIDAEWFEPLPDLPLPPEIDGGPFIACVGNVKPTKNLTRLIDAFSLIKDEIPHRLVIVGKRDGFRTGDPEVERRACQLGQRVVFTGFVEQDLLRQIVGNAELFVHPSLYEGFGFPPLEALAAGCRVVTSRIPAMSELGVTAFVYFDATSTQDIARVLRESLLSLRASSSLPVPLMASTFSWKIAASAILRLILGVCTKEGVQV